MARTILGRELAIVLAAKLVLLLVLYAFFFSPAHRLPHDGAATATHVMGAP